MADKNAMILCDANILIEFYKSNPTVIKNLKQIGYANIAVSVITKAELFYGTRDKQELTSIERYLSSCLCVLGLLILFWRFF
jgi:tRNA(fMet)-specific endonuclease VapC